jgi:hypothetical protein
MARSLTVLPSASLGKAKSLLQPKVGGSFQNNWVKKRKARPKRPITMQALRSARSHAGSAVAGAILSDMEAP